MKKQGDLYLKIVSIVLAGIVVAYLVLSVLFGSGGGGHPPPPARVEKGHPPPHRTGLASSPACCKGTTRAHSFALHLYLIMYRNAADLSRAGAQICRTSRLLQREVRCLSYSHFSHTSGQ